MLDVAHPHARRTRWARLGTLALIVTTALALLWGGLTVRAATTTSAQAFEASARARDVTHQAEALLAATLDAESGLRGYLATGDTFFLNGFHRGANDTALRSEALLEAAAEAPGLDVAVASALADEVRVTVEELRATLGTARLQGLEAAQERLSGTAPTDRTASVRVATAQVTTAADALAADAADRAEQSAHASAVGLGTTGVLVVGTLGALAVLTRQRGRWESERDVLLGEVAALALRDPLTGLANRRSLREHLEASVRRARRRGGDVAVLFVDLDGFKQVNDRHGHAIGDVALSAVAALVAASVRSEDIVARVGGDEFVVLVEGAEDEDLDALVRRVRDGVALASDGCSARHGTPEIGASLGVSRLSDVAGDVAPTAAADQLLSRADRLMYADKQAGRAGTR